MNEGNLERNFKIIAAIADVHIGNQSLTAEETKHQLKEGLINKLKTVSFLDGIVICGDTLHRQLSLNSEYANVYQWFIAKLIKIAREHNAFIRIIKGTHSHDNNELEAIRHYENDFDLDYRIITNYEIEEIQGMRFAYIPEDYINEIPEEYYKDIFSKDRDYFDMIFFHGLIEPCRFFAQNSENIDSSAPVLKLHSFYDVCKGPIIAGHIHTPMEFNDKFYYVGSALVMSHGEENGNHGFDIIGYVPETGNYTVDKIINEYTLNFETYKLDNEFIVEHDANEIVDSINKYVKKHNIDRLALKVSAIDSEETSVKIELLKKHFSKDNSISISFKILSEKVYEQEVKGLEKKEKAAYLADGLDIVERIQLWALEKRNFRISKEDIVKYITSPVKSARKEIGK